jgi:gamma-glutamylputrescine oxidase
MPMVGQVSGERDVWFSGAWCGHGLALSTASGARIADALDPTASTAAAQATELAWQRGRGPWLPGGPLRPLGLGAYVLGLDGVDRAGLFAERALRRRRR